MAEQAARVRNERPEDGEVLVDQKKGRRGRTEKVLVRDKRKKKREKKEKKPPSPLKSLLVGLTAVILLLGAAGALVFFDIFGAKRILADTLGLTQAAADVREERLRAWETELQNDAMTLKNERDTLDMKEKEVSGRESEAEAKTSELDGKIAEYETMLAQLSEENTDINDVIKVLESMSAETAAPALLAMTDRPSMLRVFAGLKTATQSALLETMTSEDAASILEQFTDNRQQ
jgi:Skp family chaperone for outer membrane proteins